MMTTTNDLENISEQARLRFSMLSAGQLNWKPAPDKWSIAQCLDHLIVSNTTYFPSFDKLIDRTYRLPLLQRLNPMNKVIGPFMIKQMGPQNKKKFKAPFIFRPSASFLPHNILERFLQHQEKLKEYFSRLERLDEKNTVIASPVSSFFSYSLKDAKQILVVHEQRHLAQAIRVLNHPNFPKS